MDGASTSDLRSRGLLTEAEVSAHWMSPCHSDLILACLRRLGKKLADTRGHTEPSLQSSAEQARAVTYVTQVFKGRGEVAQLRRTAREQLARMTIVFRASLAWRDEHWTGEEGAVRGGDLRPSSNTLRTDAPGYDFNDGLESRIHDIIEASLYTHSSMPWSASLFRSPESLHGREWEIAALVEAEEAGECR